MHEVIAVPGLQLGSRLVNERLRRTKKATRGGVNGSLKYFFRNLRRCCTCGYLGGVAPAALGRAADEPRRADDEPRHEGDLAARGRAAEELLDVDVIDYVRLR